MENKSYSSARPVHSLHKPYENAEPAGIRPIAKQFLHLLCLWSAFLCVSGPGSERLEMRESFLKIVESIEA